MLLLRLPKALAPTLVGTKLLLPIPPDRLRKSARRWVTQVAVLQARFCAVTLLQESKRGLMPGSDGAFVQLFQKHRLNHNTVTSATYNMDFLTCGFDENFSDHFRNNNFLALTFSAHKNKNELQRPGRKIRLLNNKHGVAWVDHLLMIRLGDLSQLLAFKASSVSSRKSTYTKTDVWSGP